MVYGGLQEPGTGCIKVEKTLLQVKDKGIHSLPVLRIDIEAVPLAGMAGFRVGVVAWKGLMHG